jgi:hypothetical protein
MLYVLVSILFLLYINDLPAVINNTSKTTLFADDINLILVSPDLMQLRSNLVAVFGKTVDWFPANSLTLNQKRHTLCISKRKRIKLTNRL